MNELVQLVQQKTGLSQEMAETVVNTVISHLKSRLPEGLAGGLDQLLACTGGGGTPEGSLAEKAESMMAGLGGMLGGKSA
jgi:hypothetical protein